MLHVLCLCGVKKHAMLPCIVSTELDRLKKRLDEFNDYGRLDMMQQYVKDTRNAYKRLESVKEQVSIFSFIMIMMVIMMMRMIMRMITLLVPVLGNCCYTSYWKILDLLG